MSVYLCLPTATSNQFVSSGVCVPLTLSLLFVFRFSLSSVSLLARVRGKMSLFVFSPHSPPLSFQVLSSVVSHTQSISRTLSCAPSLMRFFLSLLLSISLPPSSLSFALYLFVALSLELRKSETKRVGRVTTIEKDTRTKRKMRAQERHREKEKEPKRITEVPRETETDKANDFERADERLE